MGSHSAVDKMRADADERRAKWRAVAEERRAKLRAFTADTLAKAREAPTARAIDTDAFAEAAAQLGYRVGRWLRR